MHKLFLLFIVAITILLSSCATLNLPTRYTTNTVIPSYNMSLMDKDLQGNSKVILQIQTTEIPQSFVTSFDSTFTAVSDTMFSKDFFISNDGKPLTVERNKYSVEDYIKRYKNSDFDYLILIIPSKAFSYKRTTYSNMPGVGIGAGFGMGARFAAPPGFGQAPMRTSSTETGVELHSIFKIINLRTENTEVDYDSYVSVTPKKMEFYNMGIHLAKEILNDIGLFKLKPQYRVIMSKLKKSEKIKIDEFIDYCKFRGIKVKNSRLDYIISPDHKPVYIPKRKDGYIKSSFTPNLLRFVPGATISDPKKGISKKTFWDPTDEIIFDISK